ncbi:hypothetical protein NRS6096_22045 (plasmid) [Bacillus subtilis]|nr:hypothetical protein NRS6096_22045 [Bacillus subtilis]
MQLVHFLNFFYLILACVFIVCLVIKFVKIDESQKLNRFIDGVLIVLLGIAVTLMLVQTSIVIGS